MTMYVKLTILFCIAVSTHIGCFFENNDISLLCVKYKLFSGKNKKLGLTGRPSSEVGLLATSKLYVLQDQILAFIPQVSNDKLL